jgi:hypothetical protein
MLCRTPPTSLAEPSPDRWLVLTSAERLTKQIGAERLGDVMRIVSSVGDVIDYDQELGAASPDYAVTLGPGVPEAAQLNTGGLGFPGYREQLTDSIDGLVEKYLKQGTYAGLIIVGGDAVVPFGVLDNPLAELRDEKGNPLDSDAVFTDDIYADTDHDSSILPDVPVTRLPDGGDAQTLLNQLNAGRGPESGGYSVRSADFDKAREIAELIGASDTPVSPPAENVKPPSDSRDYFFLIHGDPWGSSWLGHSVEKVDDRWVHTWVRALSADRAQVDGFVLSGACYGAFIFNQTYRDDVALAFLHNGAAGFVGTTGTDYGRPNGEPGTFASTAIGLFASLFYEEKRTNDSLTAYFKAKREFGEDPNLAGDSKDPRTNRKILHELVYFGLPPSLVGKSSKPSYEGLVGYWRFDDPGRLGLDSSSGANNGSASEEYVSYSREGKVGGAARFKPGSNAGITIPNSKTLDALPAMTVAAWIKPDKVDGALTVLSKSDSGSSEAYVFWGSFWKTGDKMGTFFANGGSPDNSGVALPGAGTWYHVAVTYDGLKQGALTFYLNGKKVAALQSNANGIFANGSSLHLGASPCPGPEDFGGLMDEVRLYDRALSGAEVTSLWSEG